MLGSEAGCDLPTMRALVRVHSLRTTFPGGAGMPHVPSGHHCMRGAESSIEHASGLMLAS